MKIAIPKIYEDDKLTEGEKSFLAFMTMVGDDNGFEYFYNMNAGDVKKILGSRLGSIGVHSNKMATIRKYFHVMGYDDNNWAFAWKGFDKKTFYNRPIATFDKPKFKHGMVEINDIRSVQVWCYLLGMYRGSKNLIEDANQIQNLYFKTSRITFDRLEMENFRIEK